MNVYQALYRKWRPQTFDEVIGQEHITQTLKNQVKSGRLSHAYIFIGTRGTGKTTCARILAKAVNCEHPVDGNPCGVCPSCLGIADGTVLDVVEMDAASNNKVDNIHALREEAIFSPVTVKKRVYIIDEVHMLSTAAFNALLKILEEPPEHLMFILATTELQKVPATILSRCQRHSFHRIDTPVIASYLEDIASREDMKLTHDAADLIARLADGGMRDALSLLDQCATGDRIDTDAVYSCMGLAGNRRIAKMLDYIIMHDTASALKEFSSMWMDGKDPAAFLKELSGLIRDVMIVKTAGANGLSLATGGYDESTLSSFVKRMTGEEIISAMDTVQNYMARLRDAKNPRTVVELCLVSLCDSAAGESVNALRARVSRLEERLKEGVIINSAPVTPLQSERKDTPPTDTGEESRPREEAAFDEPAFADDVPAEGPQSDDNLDWDKIKEKALTMFAPNISSIVKNPGNRISGELTGNVLEISGEPGFGLNQVKRPEILKVFSDAVKELCGKSVTVKVSENAPDQLPKRSLQELKDYPGVIYK